MDASKIREVRKALGENRDQFATRFAVAGRTVEGWEQRHRVPSLLVQKIIQELWDAHCGTKKKAKKKKPG